MSHNRLSTLEGIKRLANLRYLDTSNNRLRELEEELTSLSLLEHLDMSFNRISQLPDNFGLLRELRFLNLSDNRIAELPNDRLDVLASVQVGVRLVLLSVCLSITLVSKSLTYHQTDFVSTIASSLQFDNTNYSSESPPDYFDL